MTNNAFAAPVLFAVVATITPGGATTLVMASGAQFGFRRSVPLIAGIAIGLATLAAAAAARLAGLLLAIPSLQLIVTLTGSAYLALLAWKIGRSGPPNSPTNVPAPTSLIGGMGLLWLNPKGWTMTLGAAASFATVAGGPFHLVVLLGTVFGLAATVSLTLWCTAGLL
jgi:threonine/homoserine/homoserine lactone efflux protein